MGKKLKIIFCIVTVLALILTASLLLGSSYLESIVFSPVSPEKCLDSEYYVPAGVNQKTDSDKSYLWLTENAEVVSIQSADNICLNAYLIKNESHSYGIFMHGYRADVRSISSYAQHFFERGYCALVPGQRGHGWSEGDFIDMGLLCAQDVKSWSEFIAASDPDSKIFLFGVSMGAASVMTATSLELPAQVVCAVEDSGYTSAYEEMAHVLYRDYGLPAEPLLSAAALFFKFRSGLSLKDICPLDSVARSKIPTLFIHGTADDYVPFTMLSELYDAARCDKEKLEVPEATHARAAFLMPELYWEKTDAFVEKWIAGEL